MVNLILIGLTAGIASGMFGIGGGILIVPGLIYIMRFSAPMAIGTSLAVLLPPVGIAAVYEYYKHGSVNLKSALIIAASLIVGGWLGAMWAQKINQSYLKLFFGLFVVSIGIYMVVEAAKQILFRI